MPYSIVKSGRGFYVENKETGKRYSNSPIRKSNAQAQLKALYAQENGYKLSAERRAYYSARRGLGGGAKKSAKKPKRKSVRRSTKRVAVTLKVKEGNVTAVNKKFLLSM